MSDHSHSSRRPTSTNDNTSHPQRYSRDPQDGPPRIKTPEEESDTDLAYFYTSPADEPTHDQRWEENPRRSFEEGGLKPGKYRSEVHERLIVVADQTAWVVQGSP